MVLRKNRSLFIPERDGTRMTRIHFVKTRISADFFLVGAIFVWINEVNGTRMMRIHFVKTRMGADFFLVVVTKKNPQSILSLCESSCILCVFCEILSSLIQLIQKLLDIVIVFVILRNGLQDFFTLCVFFLFQFR